MAEGEFEKALPRILVYEGGKVDDPQDPGGRTNKGVTQATYNSFRRSMGLPSQDVYLIASAEVATIYKTRYWDKVMGDQMPEGLGLNLFDGAVNSGVSRSGIWLQQALGGAYTGQIDGLFGAKTLQAIADFDDVDGLIRAYCAHRMGTLKALKLWSRYGKGWAARIANVQKTGVAWQDAMNAPHPVDLVTLGGHRKAVVQDNLEKPFVSQMATHVATAGASIGTLASQTAAQISPLSDTFAWMKYVFGGFTLAAVVAGIAVKISTDASQLADKGAATAPVDLDADADSQAVPVDDASPPSVNLVPDALTKAA
jgi:lysozyme family protein